MSLNTVRADLHVHSLHSDSPKIWFLDKVNARECWTKPENVYRMAIDRGMDLVTISDHDTINGALEIMHHGPHVFISEEISARFPENGYIAHILVHDITEAQHDEVQRLRYNIYDLVPYLRQEDICHVLAHPLSDVNHRLRPDLVEKMFLMFKNMEVLNGPRDAYHYHALMALSATLTRADLERWANKHDLEPVSWDPARHWTGGSDDHSGIGIARDFTLFDGDKTPAALCAAINEGRTRVDGDFMTPEALGHTIYSGTIQYHQENSGHSAKENIFRLIETAFTERKVPDLKGSPMQTTVESLFRSFMKLSATEKDFKIPTMDEIHFQADKVVFHNKLYKNVGMLLHDMGAQIAHRMVDQFNGFRFNEMFYEVARLMELAFLCVPYFIGFRYFYNDRKKAETMVRALNILPAEPIEPRVAIFTDTIDSVNGVSLSLRRLADQLNDGGHFVKLVGLETPQHDAIQGTAAGEEHVVRFDALVDFPLVAYNDMSLGVPPLLAMLDWVVRNRITMIQCSTPGPVGIVGLVIAKLLGVKVVGNYHTQVPEFAERLTGDATVGRITRGYVRWFYNSLEHTIAATEATREYLIDMGLRADRIQVVPRGVDVDQFNPARRVENLWHDYGLNGSLKLLYVGRVSKEKNVDQLLGMVDALQAQGVDVELAIVGDGPYRKQLQEKAALKTNANGDPIVAFTGYLKGDALANAYASADLFVFPSTTDTFGNVVLEAQASGLPAVVTDSGGPSELVEHNRTGLIVPADNVQAMANAIQRLATEPARRERMAEAARRSAEGRSYQSAAEALWTAYRAQSLS